MKYFDEMLQIVAASFGISVEELCRDEDNFGKLVRSFIESNEEVLFGDNAVDSEDRSTVDDDVNEGTCASASGGRFLDQASLHLAWTAASSAIASQYVEKGAFGCFACFGAAYCGIKIQRAVKNWFRRRYVPAHERAVMTSAQLMHTFLTGAKAELLTYVGKGIYKHKVSQQLFVKNIDGQYLRVETVSGNLLYTNDTFCVNFKLSEDRLKGIGVTGVPEVAMPASLSICVTDHNPKRVCQTQIEFGTWNADTCRIEHNACGFITPCVVKFGGEDCNVAVFPGHDWQAFENLPSNYVYMRSWNATNGSQDNWTQVDQLMMSPHQRLLRPTPLFKEWSRRPFKDFKGGRNGSPDLSFADCAHVFFNNRAKSILGLSAKYLMVNPDGRSIYLRESHLEEGMGRKRSGRVVPNEAVEADGLFMHTITTAAGCSGAPIMSDDGSEFYGYHIAGGLPHDSVPGGLVNLAISALMLRMVLAKCYGFGTLATDKMLKEQLSSIATLNKASPEAVTHWIGRDGAYRYAASYSADGRRPLNYDSSEHSDFVDHHAHQSYDPELDEWYDDAEDDYDYDDHDDDFALTSTFTREEQRRLDHEMRDEVSDMYGSRLGGRRDARQGAWWLNARGLGREAKPVRKKKHYKWLHGNRKPGKKRDSDVERSLAANHDKLHAQAPPAAKKKVLGFSGTGEVVSADLGRAREYWKINVCDSFEGVSDEHIVNVYRSYLRHFNDKTSAASEVEAAVPEVNVLDNSVATAENMRKLSLGWVACTHPGCVALIAPGDKTHAESHIDYWHCRFCAGYKCVNKLSAVNAHSKDKAHVKNVEAFYANETMKQILDSGDFDKISEAVNKPPLSKIEDAVTVVASQSDGAAARTDDLATAVTEAKQVRKVPSTPTLEFGPSDTQLNLDRERMKIIFERAVEDAKKKHRKDEKATIIKGMVPQMRKSARHDPTTAFELQTDEEVPRYLRDSVDVRDLKGYRGPRTIVTKVEDFDEPRFARTCDNPNLVARYNSVITSCFRKCLIEGSLLPASDIVGIAAHVDFDFVHLPIFSCLRTLAESIRVPSYYGRVHSPIHVGVFDTPFEFDDDYKSPTRLKGPLLGHAFQCSALPGARETPNQKYSDSLQQCLERCEQTAFESLLGTHYEPEPTEFSDGRLNFEDYVAPPCVHDAVAQTKSLLYQLERRNLCAKPIYSQTFVDKIVSMSDEQCFPKIFRKGQLVPAINDLIESLDRRKSSGAGSFVAPGNKGAFLDYFGERYPFLTICTMLMHACYPLEQIAKMHPLTRLFCGLTYPATIAIKQEPHPKAKAEEHRWRELFVAAPQECVRTFALLKGFNQCHKDRFVQGKETHCAIGLGHHDLGIAELGEHIERLRKASPVARVITDDASGYDITHLAEDAAFRAHVYASSAVKAGTFDLATKEIFASAKVVCEGSRVSHDLTDAELKFVHHMYHCEQMCKTGAIFVLHYDSDGAEEFQRAPPLQWDTEAGYEPVERKGFYLVVPNPGINLSGQGSTGGDNSLKRAHDIFNVTYLMSHGSIKSIPLTAGDDACRPDFGLDLQSFQSSLRERHGTITKFGSTRVSDLSFNNPANFTSHDFFRMPFGHAYVYGATFTGVEKLCWNLVARYYGKKLENDVVSGVLFVIRSCSQYHKRIVHNVMREIYLSSLSDDDDIDDFNVTLLTDGSCENAALIEHLL